MDSTLNVEDIIDRELGRKILTEIKEGKQPSIGREALGYAHLLVYEICNVESDAKILRSFPNALDALIDLGRIDAAMYLFLELCDDYGVEVTAGFMKSVAFASGAKSFIVELERITFSMLVDLTPSLDAAGL